MDRISPSVYERADEGLLKLLEKANVAALSEEEYDLYEASMKTLEDEIDMEEHGYKRHAIEVAQKMLQHNKPIEEIILFSGLSKEEIEAL